MRITASVLATFTLASVLSAKANDTLATLGAGGLIPVRSSQIAMESEDLQISIHEITVHYIFRNTGDKDVDAMIAFPLPDLDGGTVYNVPLELPSQADFNFIDFKVMSGGNIIPVSIESRAFLKDQDITARLHSLGLPVSVILEPLNSALLKVLPEQRKQLEAEGLIVADDFNPPLRSAGKRGWWATWTMRVQFYWTQRFPAGKTVELIQTYRPVVGGSYISSGDDGAFTVGHYCGDSAALRKIADLKTRLPRKVENDIALFERNIKYILTTANNWSGPIRNFHLVIDSDSPDDIVLTCMPSVKKVSPVRYELNISNFRPDRELDLLILQANR